MRDNKSQTDNSWNTSKGEKSDHSALVSLHTFNLSTQKQQIKLSETLSVYNFDSVSPITYMKDKTQFRRQR